MRWSRHRSSLRNRTSQRSVENQELYWLGRLLNLKLESVPHVFKQAWSSCKKVPDAGTINHLPEVPSSSSSSHDSSQGLSSFSKQHAQRCVPAYSFATRPSRTLIPMHNDNHSDAFPNTNSKAFPNHQKCTWQKQLWLMHSTDPKKCIRRFCGCTQHRPNLHSYPSTCYHTSADAFFIPAKMHAIPC